jgi:hypothetical protein
VYPFVKEAHSRVKEVGFEKYLEEEQERAKAGVDLMGHLERRFCKTIKLEDMECTSRASTMFAVSAGRLEKAQKKR